MFFAQMWWFVSFDHFKMLEYEFTLLIAISLRVATGVAVTVKVIKYMYRTNARNCRRGKSYSFVAYFYRSKTSSYLKKIANASRIQRHLTFQITHHTFSTTITLSNVVPMETVSNVPGIKAPAQRNYMPGWLKKKLRMACLGEWKTFLLSIIWINSILTISIIF